MNNTAVGDSAVMSFLAMSELTATQNSPVEQVVHVSEDGTFTVFQTHFTLSISKTVYFIIDLLYCCERECLVPAPLTTAAVPEPEW